MSESPATPRLGFLSFAEDPDLGHRGALLVLDELARPLEFHCTAHIKPNRAQAILYGPTLEPVLFGERIGQGLLRQCEEPLALLVSDSSKIEYAARELGFPCFRLPEFTETGDPQWRGLVAVGDHPPHKLAAALRALRPDFDFLEPFGRIGLAMSEARSAA